MSDDQQADDELSAAELTLKQREKQRDEMLGKLLDWLVECLGMQRDAKAPFARYAQDIDREAAEQTYHFFVTVILRAWQQGSPLDELWCARPILFRKHAQFVKDLKRKNRTTSPTEQDAEGKPVYRARFVALERVNDKGTIDRDWALLQGAATANPPAPSTEGAALTAPAVALVPTIVQVLAQRRGDSGLSASAAKIARTLVTLELDSDLLDRTDLDWLHSFTSNPEKWRAGYSRATGTPPSVVSRDLSRITRLIKTCFYLFITLAPPQHAVANADAMNRLLELVFRGNDELVTEQRKLLQYAGASVVPAAGAWVFRVDSEQFQKAAIKLDRFLLSAPDDLLGELHDAELAYAPHVPGQTRPPRFWCVFGCPTHLPQQPKVTGDE